MIKDLPNKELRILMLEDVPEDAELITRALHGAGIDFVHSRVDTREAFIAALTEYKPDIVLSDFRLPGFDGRTALDIVRRDHPEIPVVIVTGTLGDEAAIELIKAGAKDYVLKENLKRLGHAVRRALSEERGVRQRKAAEQTMRRERDFNLAVMDTVAALIVVFDPDGRVIAFNKACEDVTGYATEEVLGWELLEALLLPEERAAVRKVWEALLATAQPSRHINHWLARNGDRHLIEWSNTVRLNADGSIEHIIATGKDITEQSRTAQALRVLSECNAAVVHAADEATLFDDICRIIVDTGGYRMAWVGIAENDPDKTVRPMACRGYDEGYLASTAITWSDAEHGRGPTGTAIRTGTAQFSSDIATQPSMAPWRDAALQHGYAASIALPLRIVSGVLGALTLYAAEAQAFAPREIALLQELADDLAFGIVSLRIRAERDLALEEQQHHLQQLRDSLESTIQVIGSTVEMRDPYTSGHQHRVAELCVAIARELGLDEERIHGLHLAAQIHDLGKIQVPAELLSKPGRLSPMEFELIKAHPQVGYDIVKNVRFPWPIAEMIYQHHEHMDGTGYPRGLHGDSLLLESKILMVADVVEAMASYRPYRPALGIEAALEEILQHRGSWYDAAAVDACVRLFREKGFAFEVPR